MANPGDSGFASATASSIGVAVSPFVDGATPTETFHPSVQRSPFVTEAPAAEVTEPAGEAELPGEGEPQTGEPATEPTEPAGEPAAEVTEPAPVAQAFSEVVSTEAPVVETVPVVEAPTDTAASPFALAQEVTPPTA